MKGIIIWKEVKMLPAMNQFNEFYFSCIIQNEGYPILTYDRVILVYYHLNIDNRT